MHKAYDNKIILTRGDSAKFEVDVYNTSGEKVELDDDLTVTFTVKSTIYDDEALIVKHGLSFDILPEDTEKLEYGSYVYDVEVTDGVNYVDTIITPSPFIISGEVTF